MFWLVGLYLVFLVGRAVSSGVFWGVCELSMILGRLSANGGGVVFLSCWLTGLGHPALELAGHWVDLGLGVEMEISGRALVD